MTDKAKIINFGNNMFYNTLLFGINEHGIQ